MSSFNPQLYANALYALLSSLSGFKTYSQKLKSYADVPQGEQPSLIVPDTMKYKFRQSDKLGMPPKITISGRIWIYARTGAEAAATTGQVINPLVAAVCGAIEPLPNYKQTLGGIVQRCNIEGDIITDEGLIGQQGVAVIPIQMFLFGPP